MTDLGYEALVAECVRECLGYAEDMMQMYVSLDDAAVQAVNIVLDEPVYAGNEVDMNFRNAVLTELKEQLLK